MNKPENLPYRPGVGVMLINSEGKVFVGQRLDSTLEAWQMPQGGVDAGEATLEAAYRELEEETGIARPLIEIIGCAEEELLYDLPKDLIGKLWKGRYRGSGRPGIWPGFSAATPTSTSPPSIRNSAPGNGPIPPSFQR